MDFEDLKNPELQEKLKSAKSFEELAALVREEGMELPEEQLEAVAGGAWNPFCSDYDCARDGGIIIR